MNAISLDASDSKVASTIGGPSLTLHFTPQYRGINILQTGVTIEYSLVKFRPAWGCHAGCTKERPRFLAGGEVLLTIGVDVLPCLDDPKY